MRCGFLIDHHRCIGCHACTVACKEEHNVPIGVYRTWVKYIEKGEFPDTKRYFSVLRCNHCDDAPCIEICPTVALFRRSDGIVDFDNDRCIGLQSRHDSRRDLPYSCKRECKESDRSPEKGSSQPKFLASCGWCRRISSSCPPSLIWISGRGTKFILHSGLALCTHRALGL